MAYPKKKELMSNKKGDILQSTRMFGVEIEFICKNEKTRSILDELHNEVLNYGGDGSLNFNGREVRTFPASGDKGEELINKVGEILAGETADFSCGLHVHLDGEDLKKNIEAFKTLWIFHIKMGSTLRSLLPRYRRSKTWCKPLESVVKAVSAAEDIGELEFIWREDDPELLDGWTGDCHQEKNPSKHYGLNLFPFFSEGHFEIRYHEGTVNAKEILEWVNLNALITDSIVSGALDRKWVEEVSARKSLSLRTRSLFKKIGLAKSSVKYFEGRQKRFSKLSERAVNLIANLTPSLCADLSI